MPDPALPVPPPEPTRAARFRRTFRDPRGRPLTGRVSLMPVDAAGEFVAVPVPVELVDGVAEVDVRPGVYLLSGILRTVERTAVVINDKLTLT